VSLFKQIFAGTQVLLRRRTMLEKGEERRIKPPRMLLISTTLSMTLTEILTTRTTTEKSIEMMMTNILTSTPQVFQSSLFLKEK
jgi:hypothetical protein